MADLREFHGPNAGYVLDLYERFQRDPSLVDEGWRSYFASFTPTGDADAPAGAPAAQGADVSAVLGAYELAVSIRARGHTAARLDPLGGEPRPDPSLRPEAHGISDADLARLPASVVRGAAARGAGTAADAIARLRAAYSGTAGYEFDHVGSAEERAWLQEAVETGRFRAPLDADAKRALLARLSQVEGFEKYLHRVFFGQKRFSIEGTDAMVPMLDEVIRGAAGSGAGDVLIGMAHRGRLNVLTHVMGKPYSMMVAAFASAQLAPGVDAQQNTDEPSGDVKYHMGWKDTKEIGGAQVRVTLSPNPSHLEFVDPVVVGMTRAAQDDTSHPGPPALSAGRAVAVLIHGDAAFPGQGTVPETLNMSGLRGYTVGGTLHLIANNQIGFTTDPVDDRSTRYASDLAKGFEMPVAHVNADDAEECLAVMRLAFAYRQEFGRDFVVDLVGYRRWGHNEGDEPAFTQPMMYEAVRSHPTAREVYAAVLAEQGVVSQDDADAMLQRVNDEMSKAADEGGPAKPHAEPSSNGRHPSAAETGVPAERLKELNAALLQLPDGFQPAARIAKTVLEKRRTALDGEKPDIDWGHAEALAFASLLQDGTPVRITGQDAERGTFSHRHAVLNDAKTGAKHNALQQLPQAKASFEVHNSPLSEMAVVGFEYGYSVADPKALVLWEAQYGDFANGAQVMIDQYLASSYQKWQQTSGMVLLLPHGYEGGGPEHSSARLERYLQLCAEGNLRVVNCTTSAQYFHLIRRQAQLLGRDPRPLVVMSPKSLLRQPLAGATVGELASGSFRPVLPDATAGERKDGVTRLLLCSGKVWVDLVGLGEEQRKEIDAIPGRERVALARVEELYPFPAEELGEMIRGFPALREVVWVQEEPRNMGAWTFAEPRLREIAGQVPVRYEGRPDRASPAEGSAVRHVHEQNRIVRAAWADAPEAGGRAMPQVEAAAADGKGGKRGR